ncbi:MAG: glycosyltransferase family 39 protein [Isosphaeraceae bacterium]
MTAAEERFCHPGQRQEMTGMVILGGILALATALRAWKLGQLSFWYDEIVTMRLATAPTPAALFDRLVQIDATRAPLHPLLLQCWIGLFGSSEAAGRSLSVVCGIVTIGLVYWIGLLVFDRASGLWAAWLAAISPPLVYYSREARMYALLVMIACLCWGLLFSLRKASSHGKSIAYALCLAALVYCHPLGLLMAATLGLGSFLFVRRFFDRRQRWLGVHLAALLLAAPWIGHYFDHDPEFLSGQLPVRFLIGTPIGFIGGNSVVLLGLLILIGFGLLLRRGVFAGYSDWSGPACLVLWLVVPPTLLYAYSWLGNPVFGPSRYTLYTAPAYLILVAQGLARLPPLTRACVAVALALLIVLELGATVYAPGLKADWRAFSTELAARMAWSPGTEVTVFVKSSDPVRNTEIQTARYYLPGRCRIVPLEDAVSARPGTEPSGEAYVAVGTKEGSARLPLADVFEIRSMSAFAGLTVYRVVVGPHRGPRSNSRRSAASGR